MDITRRPGTSILFGYNDGSRDAGGDEIGRRLSHSRFDVTSFDVEGQSLLNDQGQRDYYFEIPSTYGDDQ